MQELPRVTPLTVADTTFYATREYYEQLIHDIETTNAGDRILLVTMSYELQAQQIRDVVDALVASAHRGVTVILQIDANSYLEDTRGHIGPLAWHKQLPRRLPHPFRETQASLEMLRKAGATTVVTNIPARTLSAPMVGRSHIKTSIVNDKIYIGGCNLSDMHLDVMAAWHDAKTADWLFALLEQRITEPQTIRAFGAQDIRHTINDHSEMLVDVGVAKQSLIYEEALAVIDRAEDWLVITCQFFPYGVTAKHLKQASERGVRVIPIFNHYKAHYPLNQPAQFAARTRERMRMPASFFDTELPPTTKYFHAKLIATEKEALLGSHNYVTAGVNFGTAEIALHNKTAAFSRVAAQVIVEETGLRQNPSLSFLFD